MVADTATAIRLDELVTTTTVLALDRLLSEDSTFYGDLFPHAVKWKGVVYLEDGLHRAVRAALRIGPCSMRGCWTWTGRWASRASARGRPRSGTPR